jgi:hypothetical protein
MLQPRYCFTCLLDSGLRSRLHDFVMRADRRERNRARIAVRETVRLGLGGGSDRERKQAYCDFGVDVFGLRVCRENFSPPRTPKRLDPIFGFPFGEG